jgi:superoxide dismutase, Cu-Zn family
MRTPLGIWVRLFAVVGLAIAATQDTVVVIKDADGKPVGKAILSKAEPRGVKLDLDIQNLPPGEHAFHLHQKSVCDASEDFDTAGLQFDPTGEMYGNAEHHSHAGPSAGDPRTVVKVGADGTGHVSVVFPNLTLGDDKNSVFANGGTAMVFHAAAGARGPTRIACGTISQPK